MIIRSLTPTDAQAYIALRREMLADSPWAFASGPDDDEALNPSVVVTRLSQPGQAILGAFDDAGNLLGSAGLYTTHHKKMAHRAHIWGVYITPAARNRGLATALLRATLDLARTWPGITSVGLSVSERSTEAQHLYERLGFKPWGREPGALITGGRSYDEVHMVAFLAQDQ
jgi:RimJ/RimL family protein N-acetyltransferase